MRFRHLAGIAAGALTAGLLTVPALTGAAHAATALPAKFTCDVPAFEAQMDYTTDIALTLKRTSATGVSVVAELGDMPGIVPVPIASMDLKAKLSLTVDGAATTLTAAHTAKNMASKAPIDLPTFTGAGVSSTSTANVTVTRLQVDAVAMGIPVAVVCTPVGAIAGSVPVEGTVAPVAKIGSSTKVKVKVSKKKVATATVTVTGKKAKPTGKVTVTVKKGKKTVKKGKLTLKRGKVTLKTKKLKKGKYKAIVSYAGSKTYKASKKTVTFKVK
ncbi:Ig-like domain repeat protein [Nocardioides gilvus]|uniref:Ig-like domain repeat protein n=1 Tax=Nocardioides gilvus TaxID=1735589 RepID=UPI000D742D2D|nr:Ig-like domain repeat protein [Nocardioides gilvus]